MTMVLRGENNDKVYFDTDSLSAFISINEVSTLVSLFGKGNVVIPEMVYSELKNYPPQRADIISLVNNNIIDVEYMSVGSSEHKLYNSLRRNPMSIGRGEASVVSFAVCNTGVMSSNNRSDVDELIKQYDLTNYMTCDILDILLDKGLKSRIDIDQMFLSMKRKGRWLPGKTYQDYLDNYKGS